MNIQQLEYIVAVDRYKNFTKASESCCITQATLSTMVKRFEEELGVVVFDRKANPIITTEMGKEIIGEAEKALEHIKRLAEIVKSKEGEIEGQVRLGIIPTIANSLLSLVLKPILQAFPKLKISISELTTDNLLNQLRDNQLDFGVISTPISDEKFEYEVLYLEPLKVYGKLKTKKRFLLSSDIEEQNNWLLEEGHCFRNQVMDYCSLQNKESEILNLRFHSNTFETLLSMVDNFGGLTILPELYVRGLSEMQKEKIYDFEKPIPVREVSLVAFRPDVKMRTGKVLAEKIRQVVSEILPSQSEGNLILNTAL